MTFQALKKVGVGLGILRVTLFTQLPRCMKAFFVWEMAMLTRFVVDLQPALFDGVVALLHLHFMAPCAL
jgi:hypothetical protein